jgi:ATP-dependent DNA helicase PIF1
MLQNLTQEQMLVYNQIIESMLTGVGRLFFLEGFGSTGKTFVWITLFPALRSKGLIVLNASSSGIASLLLSGGRTTHSSFGIPFFINEESTCDINSGGVRAQLLRQIKLNIWDEAPMIHRFCFEAFDRKMRDIMSPINPQAKKN